MKKPPQKIGGGGGFDQNALYIPLYSQKSIIKNGIVIKSMFMFYVYIFHGHSVFYVLLHSVAAFLIFSLSVNPIWIPFRATELMQI